MMKKFESLKCLYSNAILYNSYVDDIVMSVNTLTEAKQLPVQTKRILYTGGFNMLKINSNSEEVISYLKSTLSQTELSDDKLFSKELEENLLGYLLNFANDTFPVNVNFEKFTNDLIEGRERPTKRQVLQIMMSVFDPLGLMQFITSKIKISYHRLCQEKYDCDQILSNEHNDL